MATLLPTLLEEFYEKLKKFPPDIIRRVSFPNIQNKIMVVIGMRRTGKTHFLFQTMQNLLKEIPITRLLYINFEDDRLFPMTQKQFGELVDDFYSLYPENHDHVCHLFFDEIQNVENWHMVIRRYFDTKKVKIYLTGSSAKLLSKEIATSLRGRSIAIEMWPFSYKEFLEAKNISFPSQPLGKKSLDQLKGWLGDYLDHGGFPETIKLEKQDDYSRILQDYVSVVVFRDIIERYSITNVSLIRYMIKMLLKNVGCAFSIHKFFNDLKSQSFQVSKTTIHDYLEYINDAYLSFAVPIYSESLRKTQSNPKKIYAVDTGLVRAYGMGFNQNLGHYFENLIYLDLRRQGHEIYYYLTETRREVDFLSRDLQGKWHLYQVTWDMKDPKTLERETLALEEAEKELKIKGEIITPDSYFTSFLPTLLI